jgi:hypothetical protein
MRDSDKDKLIDLICFVGGAISLAMSLMSYHGPTMTSGIGSRAGYFPFGAKLGVPIGIALLIIGFLRMFWRKKEKGHK